MLIFRGSSATIQGLPEGRAWIHFPVRTRSLWPAAQQVEIRAGRTTPVTIRILERVEVNIRLRMSDAPAAPVTLRASPMEDLSIFNFAGSHGYRDSSGSGFKINSFIPATGEGTVHLTRGRWFLDFRAEGFAAGFKEVDVRSREDVFEYTLSPATEATLTLSGPANPIATYVLIHQNAPSMDWMRRKIQDEGDMATVQNTAGVIVGEWSGQFQTQVRLTPGQYWMAAAIPLDRQPRESRPPPPPPPPPGSRARVIRPHEFIVLGAVECPGTDKWSVTFAGDTNSVALTATHGGRVVPNQDIVLLASRRTDRGLQLSWTDDSYGQVQARTGPDGVASAIGLRPGYYAVFSRLESVLLRSHSHRVDLESRAIHIDPGKNEATVDLEVTGGTMLGIQLSIDEGYSVRLKGVVDAVTRQSLYGDMRHRMPFHEYDQDITVLGHIPPGNYEVHFETARVVEQGLGNRQVANGQIQVTVEAGVETSVEHHVAMHTVAGSYTTPRGFTPVPVQVSIVPEFQRHPLEGARHARTMQTEADGKFEFTGVPEGRYLVIVGARVAARAGRAEAIAAATELIEVSGNINNLRLSPPRAPTGSIEITVAGDGRGMSFSAFSARLMHASTGETIAPFYFRDERIRRVFEHVPPGAYTLETWGNGIKTMQTQVRVRANQTTEVKIELERAPQVNITLKGLPHDYVGHITWVPEDSSGNRIEGALPGASEHEREIRLTEIPPRCTRIRIKIVGFEDVVVQLPRLNGENVNLEATVKQR
jgi:hypothetical protein